MTTPLPQTDALSPSPAPKDRPLVETRELQVQYTGSSSWVLGGIDFSQFAGHLTAVVGPSGCGKSTLVRALCGLIPHSIPSVYRGNVLLNGSEMADLGPAQIGPVIAYVGQNPDASVVTQTIFNEVAFGLQNLRLAPEEIETRVGQALAAVGLAERAGWGPVAAVGRAAPATLPGLRHRDAP